MYNEFIYFKSIMSHLNMRFVIYFVEQSANKIFLIDNCAVLLCWQSSCFQNQRSQFESSHSQFFDTFINY